MPSNQPIPPQARADYPLLPPGTTTDPRRGGNRLESGHAARSRLVAGLLGVLLGGFGAHRFYLGYPRQGVLMVLVTLVTLGIGAVWGLIEGVLILVGSSAFRSDADGVPLR
jgi:TM2 domain-containing membrane protein YozV